MINFLRTEMVKLEEEKEKFEKEKETLMFKKKIKKEPGLTQIQRKTV